MLAAIQSYFGEGAVLLMVIGACLLAIRSLRRHHRQKGSACAGGCAGCGMTGICHSEGPQNPLLSAYRHDHPSGQSPQYPGSFSGGDSASEHGCEIGKR